MPDTIDDARRLIQSRLADIDAEINQLERALASLGDGGVTSRRGPGSPPESPTGAPAPSKPKRASGRRRATKRAKRGQRQEELLATIKKMRGASPAELADSIGIGSNQAYGLIRKAEADGRITKMGQGYALKG